MSALNLSPKTEEDISLLIEDEENHEREFLEDMHDISKEENKLQKHDERDISGSSLIEIKRITREERRIQRINSDLLTSIEDGDTEKYRKCLREGASVNATCRASKLTACHAAIFFHRCALLEDLLKKDAQILPMANNGYYPQHVAAWKGCQRCLQTLYTHHPESISIPIADLDDLGDEELNSTFVDSWYHDHELQNIQIPFIAEGSTALHVACRQLHVDCMEFLLTNNANIEARDSYGRLALDMIVKTIESIHELKCSLMDKNVFFGSRRSVKAEHSSEEIIEEFDWNVTSTDNLKLDKISENIIFLLINHAASSTTVSGPADGDNRIFDWRSTNVLHSAVIIQNEKLIKFLLGRNVDVESCMLSGDTPLHLAVRYKLKASLDILIDDEKIKSVLEIKEKEGKTPFLLAVENSWNYGVNILLEAGCNVLAITDKSDNVLHLAAKINNAAFVQEIFQTFPEIKQILNYKNILNETPLMVAVFRGHFRCVKNLIVFGADCQVRDENTNTVAHLAARGGHFKVLELILHRHPNLLNTKTKFGETSLHLAVVGGHVDIVRLLLRKGCHIRTEMRQTLLKEGSQSAFVQNFHDTALHYAARVGQLDMLRCLIECDRNLVNTVNDAGWCPLQTAVLFNQPECAEYILKHGGDLSHMSYLNGSMVSVYNTLCLTFNDPVGFLERICDACIEMNNEDKEESLQPSLYNPVSLHFTILRPSKNQTENFNVLLSVIRCSDAPELSTKILSHPLTQIFVYIQWKKLGKYPLIASLILHLILLSSLFWLNLATKSSALEQRSILGRVILACLLPLYIKEIYLAIKRPRSFFKRSKVLVRWITYVMTVIAGLRNVYFYEVKNTRWWQPTFLLPIVLLLSEISDLLELIFWCNVQSLFIRQLFLTGIRVTRSVMCCLFGMILLDEFISANNIYSDISDCPREDSKNVDRLLFSTSFVLTALSGGWLLIIMYFSNDTRCVKCQPQLRVLTERIEYLDTLQIFLFDNRLLQLLPQKFRKIIKIRRKIPDPFVISRKEFEEYKRLAALSRID